MLHVLSVNRQEALDWSVSGYSKTFCETVFSLCFPAGTIPFRHQIQKCTSRAANLCLSDSILLRPWETQSGVKHHLTVCGWVDVLQGHPWREALWNNKWLSRGTVLFSTLFWSEKTSGSKLTADHQIKGKVKWTMTILVWKIWFHMTRLFIISFKKILEAVSLVQVRLVDHVCTSK